MNNESPVPIFPDDPRITAYAFGELAGEECNRIAAAVQLDPALQAAVRELRALQQQLHAALAAEDNPVESGPLRPLPASRRPWGKLLPFSLGLAATLAAASVAVVAILKPGFHAPPATASVLRSTDTGFILYDSPRSNVVPPLSLAKASVAPAPAYRIVWQPVAEAFASWTSPDGFQGLMQVTPGPSVSLKPLVISRYELAVCSADFSRKVRVPLTQPPDVGAGYTGTLGTLTKTDWARLQALGNGRFYAALFVEGFRRSNVATFSIQPAATASKTSVAGAVHIRGIDASGDGAITHLALQLDPEVKRAPSLPLFPELIVDGVRCHSARAFASEIRSPAAAGSSVLLDLASYTPPVPARAEHRVEVATGPFQTPAATVRIDQTLRVKFDEAFAVR